MQPSFKRLDKSRFRICDLKVLRLLASLSFLDRLCHSLGPRYLNECLPKVVVLILVAQSQFVSADKYGYYAEIVCTSVRLSTDIIVSSVNQNVYPNRLLLLKDPTAIPHCERIATPVQTTILVRRRFILCNFNHWFYISPSSDWNWNLT